MIGAEASIAIAVAIVLIVFFVALYYQGARENFSSLGDKADQLSGWMRANPSAVYTQYIDANPSSNIVEYTILRDLHARNKLNSRDSVIEALRIRASK